MKKLENNKRESCIDLIKVLATLFALSIHGLNLYHYVTQISVFDVEKISFFLNYILAAFFITSVPLFIMVTGYLNFKNSNYQKNYKRLIFLMVIYLFIGIFTLIMRNYNGEHINFSYFVYQLLSFDINGYSWFFQMYIGLFLLFWPLNKLYKAMETRENKFKLIIILLIIVLVPTTISVMQNIIFGYTYYAVYWTNIYPILYYYIGSYIAEYDKNSN